MSSLSPRSRLVLSVLILFFGGGVFFAGIFHIPKTLAQSPPLGPSLNTQENGTSKQANTKVMNFVSGCTVTGSGTTASVTCNGSGGTVTSVTASLPLSSSGGATPNLTIAPTPTTNGRLIYDTGTTYGAIADVATGQVLTSNGVTGTPAYSASPSVTTLTGTTSVLSPLHDVASAGTLSLGTGTATGITAGKSGVPLTATGGLLANDLDRITTGALTIGTSTANGITIGGGSIVTTVAGTGGLQVAGNIDRSTAANLNLGTVNASGITIGTASTSVSIASTVSGTLSFSKESAHTLNIATSTTAATAGGALTINSGAGNGAAGGALTFDSGTGSAGGAIQIGNANAASVGIGRSGITTTLTGAFTQLTGAVSITGNAASSLTTTSGALTLTGAAASIWSNSQNGTAGGSGFNLTVKAGQAGNAANPTAGGTGASLFLIGGKGGNGDGTAGPGAGGVGQLAGGAGGTQGGTGSGNGGAANVTGGDATGTAGTGGNVNITGGAGAGSGGAGVVQLNVGVSANVIIHSASATAGLQLGGQLELPQFTTAGLPTCLRDGAEAWDTTTTTPKICNSSSWIFLPVTTNLLISQTAPTISSGFGTSPSVTANNGSSAFRINVGTGGTASSGVIGLPTATTGWNCFCNDITTHTTAVTDCVQTASTTTTATIKNYSDIAVETAWVASDILAVSCFAY